MFRASLPWILSFACILCCAATAPGEEIQMPTPALQAHYDFEKSRGALRSPALAQALILHAQSGEVDERLALLRLAAIADPVAVRPHLLQFPLYLRKFDVPSAVLALTEAKSAIGKDAVQRAEWLLGLQRLMHGALLAGLAALAFTFLLRSLGFLRHVLSNRHPAPGALLLLQVGPPLALTFMYPAAGVFLTLLFLAALLTRPERIAVGSLCVLLAAAELSLPLCAPEAVLTNPGSHVANLAELNLGRGVPDAPERLSKQSVSERERRLVLGMQAHRLGDLDGAMFHFRKSLKIDSLYALPYVNLANLYFSQGDLERAASGYRKGQTLAPESALPYANLGQAYLKMLEYEEADRELREAARHGMEDITEAQAAWLDDKRPVLDMTLSPPDLRRLAAVEAQHDPEKTEALLATWRGHGFHGLPAFGVGLAFLFLGIVLFSRIRWHSLAFECIECGVVCCHHCAPGQGGSLSVVCPTCDVPPTKRSTYGYDPVAKPRRKVRSAQLTHQAGPWLAAIFPGTAQLLQGKATAAIATVLLAALTLGSMQVAAADPTHVSLALASFLFLYLPGLLQLRNSQKPEESEAEG